ncbi:hypothetical protein [Asticcacaulis machinosus]|uniref:Uncharacterized protein n=1 Tax=Asticcacaulis machinosus TaxID=2984211 RepID=A0ABT5HFK7_9CAUL|nr:hypothetical protein [Asticcacaulis machinosus]MDC7675034.1 hypothetical protein [Asticcacaulis machinosus]
MERFLPTLIILSAAGIAILLILYRVWNSRVEQPKKLEDELNEALDGTRPDVQALEPVRRAACAIAYNLNRVVIVREFGKIPTRIYPMRELMGIEIFVDSKVVARVLRSGPHKMLDDIAPQVNRVTMRLIFDDPARPDFELVLWDPNDSLTARAEGPRGAMETARRWFYHVEAVIRRPKDELEVKAKEAAPPESPAPTPPSTPTPPNTHKPFPPPGESVVAPPAKPVAPKDTSDVLDAPIIPYLDLRP